MCRDTKSESDASDADDIDWTIIHSLIEANIRTLHTLEEFYLHRHFKRSTGTESVEHALQHAISTHKEIQEDLESLEQMLLDRDDD